jgi:hypothetical protein
MPVMVASGIIFHHEVGMIALTALVTVASIQIGYFVGCILQYWPADLPAQTAVALPTLQDHPSDLGPASKLLHH